MRPMGIAAADRWGLFLGSCRATLPGLTDFISGGTFCGNLADRDLVMGTWARESSVFSYLAASGVYVVEDPEII